MVAASAAAAVAAAVVVVVTVVAAAAAAVATVVVAAAAAVVTAGNTTRKDAWRRLRARHATFETVGAIEVSPEVVGTRWKQPKMVRIGKQPQMVPIAFG